jgi:hypothetical protein
VTQIDIATTANLRGVIDRLVDRWCERRNLTALRLILAAWPSPLKLTDDWAELRIALRNVLALARGNLSPEEIDEIEGSIVAIDIALRPR